MSPAVIILAKMKKIFRAFHHYNALTPESAKTKDELGIRNYLIFQKLITNNILIPAGENKFYLDTKAETRHYLRIRQRLLFALFIVLIAAFVLAVLN